MKKYKSHSSGLLDNTFGVILAILTLNIIIFQKTNNKLILSASILFGLSLIIVNLLLVRKKTYSIEFRENNISVFYKFSKNKKTIEYKNIYELIFLELNNSVFSPSVVNRINLKYFEGKSKSEIIFESMDDKNYINFAKWVKSKNKEIIFSASPYECTMTEKLQKEFGLNYRK